MKKFKTIISLLVLTLLLTMTWSSQSFAVDTKTAKFVSADFGEWFSIALKSDGTVWTSGDNEYGQLGVGDKSFKAGFVKVVGLKDVIAVSAADSHCVAVKKDGTVWAWGSNSDGQLGDGTYIDRIKPVKVKNLSNVKAIATGYKHTLALKKDGTVWAWGYNYYSSLGNDSNTNRNVPVKVNLLTNVKSIYAYYNDSIAVKNDGSAWIWGSCASEWTVKNNRKPVKLMGMTNIDNVYMFLEENYFTKKDGSLWYWNIDDDSVQNKNKQEVKTYISKVGSISKVKTVSSMNKDLIVLKNDGSIWRFDEGSDIPTKINVLTNLKWFCAYNGSAFAIKTNGTLWAWGDNYCGELGDGTCKGILRPKSIMKSNSISSVYAKESSSFIIKDDGKIMGFGSIPTLNNSNYYITKPTTLLYFDNTKSVATTFFNLTILKKDGAVWDSTFNKDTVLTDVECIKGGFSHVMALTKDGLVYAWGINTYGELGSDETDRINTPIKVETLSNIKSIAASGNSSFALKDDGTVWGWGYNDFILNDRDIESIKEPTKIEGLTDITAIAGGYGVFAALKKDGTVYQLGSYLQNDKYIEIRTPEKLSELSDIISITCGDGYFMALKKDGTVWNWGDNTTGQLGDGTVIGRDKPKMIKGLSDIVDMSAGRGHSMALSKDGTLWIWGEDMFGQLGTGRDITILDPIQVGITK